MEKVEDENDESWLYGNSEQREGEQPTNDEESEPIAMIEDSNAVDDQPDGDVAQFENGGNHDENSQMDDSMQDAFHDDDLVGDDDAEGEAKEKADSLLSDDDDDEDDVRVTINAIKRYDIKQRGRVAPAANAAGVKLTGKFNMEEFESVGVIAGVPAHEYSIGSLDEKPWRKPGADITDYFNYGFNEDTWRAYCERQKRFRLNESGVGLASLSSNLGQQLPPQNGVGQMKRVMPPRRGIDVVGSGRPDDRSGGGMMRPPNKENVIQVMTADRREYSRMNRSFDMNEPGGEPNFFEESQFDYMNYEPTQDSQWQNNPTWGAPGVKELTPGMNLNMPPPGMGGLMMGPGGPGGMPPMMGPMGPMGMNLPPNLGPPMMGIPPNINPNGPRGGAGPVGMDRGRGRDRGRERFDRDRAERDLRRRRSKSRSRERSRRPRSRSRERSRRPRSRSRERSRRPRSKSLERRRTRSPTQNRERNRSRENRAARRSKSPRDKRSKSRDRDRDRKKDKERERPEKPKEDDKSEKKADKDSKDDRDHKKEKKKKKDKEKSDSD